MGDSFVWSGPITGSWDVAANWTDTTTDQDPADAPPGPNDTVTINGVSNGTLVIGGAGSAASLTTAGAIDFTGALMLGAFTIGSSSVVSQVTLGGQVTATSLSLPDSFLTIGVGASLSVSGAVNAFESEMTVDGGTFTEAGTLAIQSFRGQGVAGFAFTDGASGNVAGLTSTTGQSNPDISIDATSKFEVGGLNAATAGEFLIDAGVTIVDVGVQSPTVVNNGVVNGGLIEATSQSAGATLTNNGTMTDEGGALTLEAQAPSTSSSAITNNGTIDDQTGPFTLEILPNFKSAGNGAFTNNGTITEDNSSQQHGDAITATTVTNNNLWNVNAGLSINAGFFVNSGTINDNSVWVNGFLGLSVFGNVTNSGVINDNSELNIANSMVGDGRINVGMNGILYLASVAPGQTIALNGEGASLHINPAFPMQGTIVGFDASDTLNVDNATVTSASWTSGVLTLFNGATVVENLNLAGQYGGDTFSTFSPPGQNYTQITVSPSEEPSPPTANTPPADFTGSGFSDLLWQNADGTPVIWLMNGASVLGTAGFPDPGSAWHTIATGDFNGDGKSDLLWQNTNGTPVIWEMNGTSVLQVGGFADPGSAWHLIRTGDFNGDGKSDLLWQNTDGTPVIWEMNGTSTVGTAVLSNPGASWHLIGTGDFNGDGKSDLLWQNTDGTPVIWEMNGTSTVSSAVLSNPGASWHLIGTGDFNGDGKSDLLWQNTDGTPVIWEMNGASMIASQVFGDPGSSWHLIGTGDFNGDGKSDLLWQNTDGTPVIWEMNGTSVIDSQVLGDPGSTWHLIPGI